MEHRPTDQKVVGSVPVRTHAQVVGLVPSRGTWKKATESAVVFLPHVPVPLSSETMRNCPQLRVNRKQKPGAPGAAWGETLAGVFLPQVPRPLSVGEGQGRAGGVLCRHALPSSWGLAKACVTFIIPLAHAHAHTACALSLRERQVSVVADLPEVPGKWGRAGTAEVQGPPSAVVHPGRHSAQRSPPGSAPPPGAPGALTPWLPAAGCRVEDRRHPAQ